MKTNREILDYLDEKVYGHTQAKKDLIVTLKRSQLREMQVSNGTEDEDLLEVKNMLLIGASGTGKSFLVKTCLDYLGIPNIRIDGSQLIPSGNNDGLGKKDFIKKVVDYVKSYPKSKKYPSENIILRQLVVYVDEFDKVAAHVDGGVSGKWKMSAQQSFLTLFENGDVFESITWIFSGAFSFIDKTLKHSVGFKNEKILEEDLKIDDKDLLKYGFIPEIVGRFNTISQLDKLTENDYKDILNTYILPKKIKELNILGHKFKGIDDSVRDDIVKKAMKSTQGVRYLKRMIDNIFREHEFDYDVDLFELNNSPYLCLPNGLVDEWTEEQWEEFNYGCRRYK